MEHYPVLQRLSHCVRACVCVFILNEAFTSAMLFRVSADAKVCMCDRQNFHMTLFGLNIHVRIGEGAEGLF